MSTRTKMVAMLLAAVLVLGVLLAAVLPRGGSDEEAGSGDETPAQTADLSDLPDVVAVVNGEEITRDAFAAVYEPQFQQLSQQAEMGGGEPVDEDELRQQTLDMMVDNELLVQEAAARDIEVTDEQVDETLTSYATESGMGSVEEYLSELEKQQGLSADEARAQIADGLAVQALLDAETGDEPIAEQELRELYDQAVAGQGDEVEVPPFEEVRPQLEEQVRSQREGETYQALLESIREDADIETRL